MIYTDDSLDQKEPQVLGTASDQKNLDAPTGTDVDSLPHDEFIMEAKENDDSPLWALSLRAKVVAIPSRTWSDDVWLPGLVRQGQVSVFTVFFTLPED